MPFHIYTIHNLLNNKVYIGKSENIKRRFRKHIETAFCDREQERFYIHKAIAKYGVDNFEFSVIQELFSAEECRFAERYWIKFFNSKNEEFGYNQTDGGEGCSGRIVSEDVRQKIREKAIGRKHSEETIASISGESNHKSKLNNQIVIEIRRDYPSSSLNKLAAKYKVSPRLIATVVYNLGWKDPNYIPPAPRKIKSTKIKLNSEIANEIRSLYAEGKSLLELSNKFGVSKENISCILKNKI